MIPRKGTETRCTPYKYTFPFLNYFLNDSPKGDGNHKQHDFQKNLLKPFDFLNDSPKGDGNI